jgi:hypothetical protein
VVHLLSSALKAFQIVAQGTRNRLFNRCGFLGHKVFPGMPLGSARFVILEGCWRGVNHTAVPMCPIVASREVPNGAQSRRVMEQGCGLLFANAKKLRWFGLASVQRSNSKASTW